MSYVEIAIRIALFIGGSAIAYFAGYVSIGIFGDTYPPLGPAGFQYVPVLFAFLLGIAALYGVTLAAGLSGWRQTLWTARGVSALLAGMAIAYWRFSDWHEALVLVVLATATFITHQVAHRQALGWIIDDRGERQKVKRRNRGNAIFTPTTWNQRIIEEAAKKSERRKAIFWALITGLPISYEAYRLWESGNLVFGVPLGVFGAIVLGLYAGPPLLKEVLYQGGYQDLEGAKVLDAEPQRPGIKDIATQKAHGDANVAGEAEAASLLNRGR